MTRFIDTLWRLGLSLGLLAWAVSCSGQLPAQPNPSQTVPVASDTNIPAATASPVPSIAAAATNVPFGQTAALIPSQAPTVSATPAPSTAARTTALPSVATITLADSGTVVTMQPNQSIMLDLGSEYDWHITSDNPAVVGLVPNSSGPNTQGTFQAHQAGQANLAGAGNPKCLNSVPRCLMPSLLFQVHVNVATTVPPAPTSAGAPPNITLADNGRTITLNQGDHVTLALGTDHTWDEPVSTNQSVLSRVVGILVIRGAQGVYEARSPGTSTLEANGRINCSPGQVCPQLAIHFAVQVVAR